MYRFVETMRVKDGAVENLRYHAERLNRTRSYFWPHCEMVEEDRLLPRVPLPQGLHKVRVVYGETRIDVGMPEPYAVRNVQTMKVVEGDGIDYTWKSTDRSALARLRQKAADFDEIIIIKGGCVTDTSYSNLCFYDGREWLTPDTPLLKGTMRQWLLDTGSVREARIFKEDIPRFQKVCLINAMMRLGDLVVRIACVSI